jgi:hypothetical protein
MWKEILFTGLLLTAYVIGSNRANVEIREYNRTLTEISYKNGSITCVNYTTIPVSSYYYNELNISLYYNMTERQFKELRNLKTPCNNIACGEGAIRMKYAVFDVFNIPHPKFSERPSVGYDPFYKLNQTIYLPVLNISGESTIEFNNSQWYIWRGQKSYNLSQICWGNHSYISREYYIDEDEWRNKTVYLDNLSYGNDSLWMPAQMIGQLYLRHV